MAATKVVNIRISSYDVFIGRPSKWGNPFKIGRDGTRDEVITKYEEWLLGIRGASMRRPTLDEAKTELRGRVLGCYCKPMACHGDILVKFVDREQK